MMRVAVAGAGRMGEALARALESQPDMVLAGIWGRGDDLDALIREADVVIDFSLPEGTAAVIDSAVRLGKPVVCGVSGLDASRRLRPQYEPWHCCA